MEKEKTLRAPKAIVPHDPAKELQKLWEKLNKAGDKAKGEDITRFRAIAAENPSSVPAWWSAMDNMRRQLIGKISKGSSRACLLAEVDAWKVELGMEEASPMDRLLIENIITHKLRLVYVEFGYNQALTQGAQVEYWDNLLTTTQNRFLRAVESLARIRRLGINTHTLQLNIAQAGGQQVNFAGGVKP